MPAKATVAHDHARGPNLCDLWFVMDGLWLFMLVGLVCNRQKEHGCKMLSATPLDTSIKMVNTKWYHVTAILTFLDPKHDNLGNYRGIYSNYPVIGNQVESRFLNQSSTTSLLNQSPTIS